MANVPSGSAGYVQLPFNGTDSSGLSDSNFWVVVSPRGTEGRAHLPGSESPDDVPNGWDVTYNTDVPTSYALIKAPSGLSNESGWKLYISSTSDGDHSADFSIGSLNSNSFFFA